MKRFALRGNAMPETALVMSVVLLIFLGLIQIAEIGYQQSESDAAAFVAAHQGSYGSTSSTQSSYGQSMARSVFKDFPSSASQTITVSPATSNTPNPSGNVVAYANLHSFFIEPVVSSVLGPGTVSLSIVTANPPNCTTNNKATTTCPGMTSAMATPNPSNVTDPYYAYACHAVYYAVLSNSSGFYPDQNTYFAPWVADLSSQIPGSAINYVLPNSVSLSGLTDQAGNPVTQQPWPLDFQPTASDGINNSSVRGSGTWLTTQYKADGVTPDPANADGQATVGGTLGTALQPIFKFGGASSKC
jgi:hypothetical protein